MQVKAVIFDLDGLMLDTETLSKEVWLSVAKDEKDSPVDEALYHRLVGRTYDDIRAILMEAYADKERAAIYIERCLEIYFNRLHGPIPTRPGLFEMLDWCDARGLKKAVGTSTGHTMADVKLKSGGIEGRFDAMVTASEVTKGKPDPEVFLKCAAALKVAPSEAVVLEDSPMGILAAKAGGFRSVMIPDMIQPSDHIRNTATAILASLKEVPHYMENQGWV